MCFDFYLERIDKHNKILDSMNFDYESLLSYSKCKKFSTFLEYLYRKVSNKIVKCGKTAIKGICNTCGYEYGTALFCHLEYCPTCSDIAKKRRIGRNWKRFVLLGASVGHFVFTVPKELRRYFLNRGNIRKWKRYVVRLLKRERKLFGIGRIHWFGDINKSVYKPHLHILVSDNFIPNDTLIDIKKKYKNYINRLLCKNGFNKKTNTNIQYSYTTDTKRKVHLLKYMLRNTFTQVRGNENVAIMLLGFRNSISFGYENTNGLSDKQINELGLMVYGKYLEKDIDYNSILIASGKCINCFNLIEWYKDFTTTQKLESDCYKKTGLKYYYKRAIKTEITEEV